MSIWGKIAGAATGLAIGGPLGALLGGLAGHLAIDRENDEAADVHEREVAFSMGVIALGAKMAKADGVVTKDEVSAFKDVFKVPDSELKNVARLFNLAKKDVAGYDSYARQLARLFRDDRETLKAVLDGLFHIAKADDVVHPKEEEYLASVARIFGFTDTEFAYIRARHVQARERSPYDVLELDPSTSDAEVKKRYRELVRENHPDRLMARGVPEEFVEIANNKIAAINQAYDEIAKERGL
ncbi:MAG: TerB family tellurite resistance protein [Dichotomicrobium sp.]